MTRQRLARVILGLFVAGLVTVVEVACIKDGRWWALPVALVVVGALFWALNELLSDPSSHG